MARRGEGGCVQDRGNVILRLLLILSAALISPSPTTCANRDILRVNTIHSGMLRKHFAIHLVILRVSEALLCLNSER